MRRRASRVLPGSFACLLLFALVYVPGRAWPALLVRSSSGQFVVHSPYPTTPSLSQSVRQQGRVLVSLEPDPLAVAGERVKRALLRELGLNDRWQGQIHLNISSDLTRSSAPLVVVSTRFVDGWRYSIDLPEEIEVETLMRLLVQALLTELANRSPGPRAPELPIWLVEGLAAKLRTTTGPELVPRPTALMGKLGRQMGRLPGMVEEQIGSGGIEALRGWLRTHPPLTFNDLSLPPPGLAGESLQTYRASAQLFVSTLLELPNGRQTMAGMLGLLTWRLNWQTAFLEAYKGHFPRMLSVEQWWALATVQFLAGNQPHSWSHELTGRKLNEVLQVVVERRGESNAAPSHASISLQQLIRLSTYQAHRELLRARANQLDLVSFNGVPELAQLIKDYSAVLRRYVAQPIRRDPAKSRADRYAPRPNPLARQTVLSLDDLDRRRLTLSTTRSAPPHLRTN